MAPCISIGNQGFESIREENSFYIDKSDFIREWWESADVMTLITRPRRFGKTLNMSMVNCFFSNQYAGRSDLFEGLSVWKEEKYRKLQGTYPVIFLSFADVKQTNYEDAVRKIKNIIEETYMQHAYLNEAENISETEKRQLRSVSETMGDVTAQDSLKNLAGILYRYYGKKAIILLDEYDTPMQEAYIHGYWDEFTAFIRSLFNSSFKTNPYMERGIMTGITRVSKESIFSDLNNLNVVTTTSEEYATCFGFTETEVFDALAEYQLTDQKEMVKKWYDGYTIGNTEGIYNPWSILNYLTDRKLMPYWVNTSSNDLIKLILKNSVTVKEKIEQLLRDEEIEVPINLDTVIVGIEQNEENIWGLLLGTGYLKVTEVVDLATGMYKVKIPNYEIKFLFQSIIRDWFNDKVIGNNLNTILKDLVTLKLDEFEKKFKVLVTQMFSYMDVGENTAENFYHAFVLGMLVGLKDKYYVKSNRESGYGRYDIMLEPKDKNGNSFIMEFKVLENEEEKTIEETIENAKKQIEERKYEEDLQERGYTNITKMVFAFKGKKAKMEIV